MEDGSGGDNFPVTCKNCGSTISQSDKHCKYCGATTAAAAAPVSYATYGDIKYSSGRLRSLGIQALLWAFFAIIIGFVVFSASEPDGSPFTDLMRMTSILAILSGIFSIITAILAFIRKGFAFALTACIISSVLALPLIFGIIGLFVAYKLYKYRNDFDQ